VLIPAWRTEAGFAVRSGEGKVLGYWVGSSGFEWVRVLACTRWADSWGVLDVVVDAHYRIYSRYHPPVSPHARTPARPHACTLARPLLGNTGTRVALPAYLLPATRSLARPLVARPPLAFGPCLVPTYPRPRVPRVPAALSTTQQFMSKVCPSHSRSAHSPLF
jgi:hypothetical protein